MSFDDLEAAYLARPDVRSIHRDKLTVVFTDGNHTHLDTLFQEADGPDLRRTLYALYLCSLEGLLGDRT